MFRAKRLLVCLFLAAIIVAPTRAEANCDVCLEAVGGSSAGYVYSMYMFIGVTADALTKNAYDAARVKELMGVAIKMMAESGKQLGKIEKAALSKADRHAIEEFRAILGLLEEEARALVAFAASKKPKDAERYAKLRKRAWNRISKLLGIDDGDEQSTRE